MRSEGDGLRDIETTNVDRDCINGGFTGPSCHNGIFNSTTRSSRSRSYSDVSNLNGGSHDLPATSWQRMSGLSQSICDLKVLREKQMGRRQASCILFEDDFLQEHAKKLQEARMKIKALEAKYCSPERLRFRSTFSPTDRDRRASGNENGLPRNGSIINNKEGGRILSSTEEKTANYKTSEESCCIEDLEFTTKTLARRSLCNELSQHSPADDRSDIDGGISTEALRQPTLANATKTRMKKRRPVTWADSEDLCSSDTNSVSSHSSGSRRLRMEMIPERDSESLCCLGYKGNYERLVLDDCDSNCNFPHKDNLVLQPQRRPTYYTGSQHERDSGILNSPEKTKWRSMPNLSVNQNYDHNQNNVEMMYGEAIPVDPNEDKKKHNSKFGRRSGFYVVNDSPEIIPQGPAPVLSTKKKMTFGKRLFHKKPSSNKCPSKCPSVVISSPKQAQPLARVVGFHGTNEAAYVIELHRPAASAGSFGFSTQMGYRRYRKGIFISKIIDKKAAKFFGGLLQVGDEVVEIDNTSVRDQKLASVNKLINNSEKLLITILPYVSRKD